MIKYKKILLNYYIFKKNIIQPTDNTRRHPY